MALPRLNFVGYSWNEIYFVKYFLCGLEGPNLLGDIKGIVHKYRDRLDFVGYYWTENNFFNHFYRGLEGPNLLRV